MHLAELFKIMHPNSGFLQNIQVFHEIKSAAYIKIWV